MECLLIYSLINSEKVVEPSAPSGPVYGGGPSDYPVPPSHYQVFFSLLSVKFFSSFVALLHKSVPQLLIDLFGKLCHHYCSLMFLSMTMVFSLSFLSIAIVRTMDNLLFHCMIEDMCLLSRSLHPSRRIFLFHRSQHLRFPRYFLVIAYFCR